VGGEGLFSLSKAPTTCMCDNLCESSSSLSVAATVLMRDNFSSPIPDTRQGGGCGCCRGGERVCKVLHNVSYSDSSPPSFFSILPPASDFTSGLLREVVASVMVLLTGGLMYKTFHNFSYSSSLSSSSSAFSFTFF